MDTPNVGPREEVGFDGSLDNISVGNWEGKLLEGDSEGAIEGNGVAGVSVRLSFVGPTEGTTVVATVAIVGEEVGLRNGVTDGKSEGSSEGNGVEVESAVGLNVGEPVKSATLSTGDEAGAKVGATVAEGGTGTGFDGGI